MPQPPINRLEMLARVVYHGDTEIGRRTERFPAINRQKDRQQERKSGTEIKTYTHTHKHKHWTQVCQLLRYSS